jgi:hypothetical protein
VPVLIYFSEFAYGEKSSPQLKSLQVKSNTDSLASGFFSTEPTDSFQKQQFSGIEAF